MAEDSKPMATPALTGTILDFAGHSEEARAANDPNAKGWKEGRPAEHMVGVQWIGPWEQVADGFNKHTRLSAKALAAAGVPTHLRGLSPKASNDEKLQEEVYDLLNASIRDYEMRVVQIVPDLPIAARWLTHRSLSAEDAAARNNATVVYTVWEREKMDGPLVLMLSHASQLWVACERNKRALVQAGADESKVHVVPIPFLPDDPHLALGNKPRMPGVHRFLHIGKWEARKAQDKLLHGFLLAFKPGDAELIIKTSKNAPAMDGYPAGPVEAIERALDDARVVANGWTKNNISPSIRLVRETLTDKQLLALHSWSDTYCTVSHGEGFDMPAFDAALAGRRLVYTCSGGPEDFSCAEDIRIEFGGHEPVHPWYDWEEDAVWTAVSTDDIAAALTRASALSGRVNRDLSRFSQANVGAQMRGLLSAQSATFGRTIV